MLATVEAQERAVRHRGGAALLVGAAGTGKTEALARRLARLSAAGTGPEQVLVLTATAATASRLRERVEALLSGPFEELWIGEWDALGERILREHSSAAGLDPFFDVLGPAERLAVLLERLPELPLRRHEIRGNPAGLLAALLERIDALKAGAIGAEAIEARAREEEARASDRASLVAAEKEREFAELFAAHDRILAATGSLDRGDVFLALNKLLSDRPDLRRGLGGRFAEVMIDELEDTTPAQRAILAALASANPNHLYSLRFDPERETDQLDPEPDRPYGDPLPGQHPGTAAWFHDLHPDGELIALEQRFRQPRIRFWRCTNARAQAQATAREIEHLLAAGSEAEGICVLVDQPGRRGGAIAAAMEERGIPFDLGGPAASSSAPRCVMRLPGCASWPTQRTRRRRRGR